MAKQRHTENDEIELDIVHQEGNYYELKWRYLGKRKFLWFNLPNKWYSIWEYAWTMYKDGDNPQDDMFWSRHSLNLANEKDRNAYMEMQRKVRTKKQLFEMLGLPVMYVRYAEDMKKYNKHYSL